MENYIDLFFRSLPLLLKGAEMTVAVLFGSAALSFAMGLVFGVFSSNRFKLPGVSTTIKGGTAR